VLTTIALVIGLVFAFSSGIGSGANIHRTSSPLPTPGLADRGRTYPQHHQFLMDLIPTSVMGPLPTTTSCRCCCSRCCSAALNLVGEAASGISRLINELSHVIFRIMGMIVRLAPIGVFGAIAFTTSKYGLIRCSTWAAWWRCST
jgi:aerobic C4-dicarboxylate transport protein